MIGEEPTIYILLNKDLKMSSGYAAAQAAHAAMLVPNTRPWNDPNTIIVLQASENQIRNMKSYLATQHIMTGIYIDEPGYEITALATEIRERSELRGYFWQFEPFKYKKKHWWQA